jgi:hypothetical protein
MESKAGFGSKIKAQLITNPKELHRLFLKGQWHLEHWRNGELIHKEDFTNLITNAGLDYLLDAALSGGSPITSWFIGLTDGTPTVNAADTMASHAGWVEVTDYSQANRVAWTDAGVSAQSLTNSASPASFSINATVTVGGAFLTSVNTKGGTTGTLFAVGAFTSGDRNFINGDTLNVTATYSAADDGV